MTVKQVRLIFGSVVFALLLSHSVASVYIWLYPFGSDAGWHGSESQGEIYITRVDPQSPSKDLRTGDKIIAINGVKVAENAGVLGDEYRLPPGSRYSMTLLRDGQELTFTWQTLPRQRGSFPWNKLITLLFWLSGLFVLLLKADDQQAWLLALTLGCFSTLLGSGFPGDMPLDWLSLSVALARVGGLFSLPLLLHLFLYFPQPSPWLRRWPWLTRLLYVPFCLFVMPTFGLGRLPLEWSIPILSWQPARWLSEHGLRWAGYLSLLGYLLAALLCLWLGYRRADVVGRRRLRVVMWGSLLGFGSLFLVIAMEFTNTRASLKTIWDILQFSTIFTLPLVPLSFGYAIIRHRVIPISLILRRGVRYLLVSRGSILLALLFAGLIVTALLSLLFKYLRPSALTIGLVSAAEGIAAWQAARWLHRRYLAPVIDRQFFRQSYDSQQIVAELAASLRTTTGIPNLLESVANKLQSALQTESVMIFMRDEQTGDYLGAYGCVYSPADGRALSCGCAGRLPRYAATLAQLAQTGDPLELDGGEPSFHLAATNGHTRLTAEERKTLLELKTALLLPLKVNDAMPGVVALGARLGDLPFSGDDKRLLQSVGAAASLALENARLVEGMIEEARRRQEIEAENEQRAKELEEARQLQLSMLPMSVPNLPHVEIAAFMKPATEVGGDYYDFYVGDDGALTIAIGDATGHGLKAGTVVTATKGLFNHLAEQADLVATLNQTSRALKRMNLRSLFMAMTLVRLRGDRMQCSVAGMPPILIYRAATHTIEEVPLRGAPLGGLSNYVYRQVETTLGVNDVVLLMSDGLPERFNEAGEMFGYERSKELLMVNAQSEPRTIINRLLETSEAWAAVRAADDDMTFVALKMKEAA
ncbi:MAG TPA: SpoIIE family protein phosphatase [Blastocatellia bacterium]|nr:SpoIIE family protein phosphatase [Blastocatellia bacterium]